MAVGGRQRDAEMIRVGLGQLWNVVRKGASSSSASAAWVWARNRESELAARSIFSPDANCDAFMVPPRLKEKLPNL